MQSIAKTLILLLLPLVAVGCSARATVKGSRTQNVPHVAAPLTVESANGSITVSGSDRGDVQIVAELRSLTTERLEQTQIIAERDSNDQLLVRVEWPVKRYGNEGCDFDLQIPNTMGVTLKSSNGQLSIANLDGDADLKTSNGRITIDGLDGNAKLKTSNGRITVKGVSGDIDADTNIGAIEIEAARATVIADTSNGKIHMSLADDATGPFHLESSNGGISVELNNAFRGLLSCRTSNGSINLEQVTGRVINDGKKYKVIQFGSDSTQSEIKTSNSSVKIKQRSL